MLLCIEMITITSCFFVITRDDVIIYVIVLQETR